MLAHDKSHSSNHLALLFVPGGARIIQIGGGARELYYYPKDSVLVTMLGENLKKGVRSDSAACPLAQAPATSGQP